MNITTNRMLLRFAKIEDAHSLLTIRNSAFVLKYNPMLPYTIEEMQKDILRDCNNTYILEALDTNKIIGAIFLGKDYFRYRIHAASISYYLDEKESRKGYMKEALHALLPIWLNEYEVISARVFADNKASIALMKSLNFKEEGCLHHAVKDFHNMIHDDCLFSLQKKDYD